MVWVGGQGMGRDDGFVRGGVRCVEEGRWSARLVRRRRWRGRNSPSLRRRDARRARHTYPRWDLVSMNEH